MIKDEFNIPIAIFNGAHGGQPIGFFDRPNNYSSSTESNYGRMYYRLNKTGLRNSVRAVLWSQGEADSFSNGLSTQQYIGSFENLMSYWQEDFPSVEKFFIFQTRDCDCGTVSSGRKKSRVTRATCSSGTTSTLTRSDGSKRSSHHATSPHSS